MEPMTMMAAAYIGTSVYNAYAQGEQAKAGAELANMRGQAKQAQSVELLRRAESNIADFIKEGKAFQQKQKGMFAKAGISASEGSALDVLEDSFSKIVEGVNRQKEEAEYKAKALQAGADMDSRLAGDIERGGRMQQVGTLLSGGAKAYGAYHS